MEFIKFKVAVAKQFKSMSEQNLFTVDLNKDELWETYLKAFPNGSNPIFRERTEHDCSCCRQFIKAIGSIVAIVDNKIVSIWDCSVDNSNYQIVADKLSEFVKQHTISNVFVHYEKYAGTDKNFEQLVEGVKTWEHFFVNIHPRFVQKKDDIGTYLSDKRADHDVFLRGLEEITFDAIDTVLELTDQNSLYRGEEFAPIVRAFKIAKTAYDAADNKDLHVWEHSANGSKAVMRIRNSAIGTLLLNLSKEMALEEAVRAFESVVAPMNYKRPTALVTKSMIASAKETIEELGLTSALERRYANIEDISVNNVIYADRNSKRKMSGDVFDELLDEVTVDAKKLKRVEEVPIEKFISDILPNATAIELMMENKHRNNLVSLIAPVDHTAGNLFKWGNNFSWDYNGHVADSIKERVKKAGGNVTGDLCCRLSWNNTDDLDLHMVEPNGNQIYFNDRHSYATNGELDVDMNAHSLRTDPVENIFYRNKSKMLEGGYALYVHQFNQRNGGQETAGFTIEFDFMGDVKTYRYDNIVKQNSVVVVVRFEYSHKNGIRIIESLPESKASRIIWGVNTQTFTKVQVVMNSPNHWDGQGIGNRHWFFMLEGCQNDKVARGFYNEFLKEELNKHRKVFEIVGSKMMAEGTDRQLSGLGFSSTQRNDVLCRVTGKFSRIIKILF